MTACFTGHRPQSVHFKFDETDKDCKELKKRLKKQIVNLIENNGVNHFVTGMALGVDTWCAEIVLEIKKKYPFITLECVLPCEIQAKYWSEKQRDRYFGIIEKCDKETLLQSIYTEGCMLERNEFMVESSDYVLAVWNGVKKGGTYYTIKLAKKKDKRVIIIDC